MFGGRSNLLVGIVVLALGLAQPAAAEPLLRPPPRLAVFGVQASRGFEVTVYASGYPDGTGTIAVFAADARSIAIYRTTATVTDRTVEADLGEFGMVSVKAVRTGRRRAAPAHCEGMQKQKIAVIRYEGTIEFHGEEGFTDVSATAAPFAFGVFRGIACVSEGGSPAGKPLPGAFLSVHRNPEENELMLRAIQRRPGGATDVGVQIDEQRGELQITRATEVRTEAAALRFDPRLRSATLSPPAPFAGHATFHRHASPANRWTGNLTVDLPGDSDYPLTGPGLEVSLFRPTL